MKSVLVRFLFLMASVSSALTIGAITTNHYETYVPKDHFANVEYRREMLKLTSNDPAAAAQIWTLCAEDPLFYINTFCYTYSPKDSISGYPITPFNTHKCQDEAILDMLKGINEGLDVASPKSRGIGASWMGVTTIEWCWHFRDWLSFLLTSRNERLVDDRGNPDSLFWKIDHLHRYQPKWLLPTGRELGSKDPNRKSLTLNNADNNSVLKGESTTGNIGVGGRHTAIYFDEFALHEQGYTMLTGSRDVTNCRIGNSTPRGQNHFYEFCQNIAPIVLRLHWTGHEIFNRGLYSTKEDGTVELLDDFRGIVRIREKGEKEIQYVMYPDDYPFRLGTEFKLRSPWFDWECLRCANATEIRQELEIDFLGSDFQFFDVETIQILKKKYARPPLLIGDLEFDRTTLEPKRFRENKDGKLMLWTKLGADGLPSKDIKFVVGSDVSAGTGASNSVSCVVDRKTGEKVGVFRDSNLRPHPFAEQSIALAKWFNKAKMIWDGSGPTGEIFKKKVVASGYGHIYYRRNEKKVTRDITQEPGYYLTPQARSALLEDYRDALDNHRYVNYSETGLNECLQFIKKQDGSVEHSASINAQDPSGARTAHGDEVIADALANLCMEEFQTNKAPEAPGIPVGSLAWRNKQRKMAQTALLADSLGSNW